MTSVRTIISVLSKIRPICRVNSVDVLLIDEASYTLLPLIPSDLQVMKQPLRNARYWITPRILFYILTSYTHRESLNRYGFNSRYIKALCKVTNCKIVLSNASFNDWEGPLIESRPRPRVISFQTGLLSAINYRKSHDILISWGRFKYANIQVNQLVPFGSYSLAIARDASQQNKIKRSVGIMLVSIVRESHLVNPDEEQRQQLAVLEKILELCSCYQKTSKICIGFAHNAKTRAPWYSKNKFGNRYENVLNAENDLISRTIASNKLTRFYRCPIGNQSSSYVGLNTSRLVVGFSSAILVEAVGAGCRTLFCHQAAGPASKSMLKTLEPSIPSALKLNSLDYGEFARKIESLLNMSEQEYRILTGPLREKFINQHRDYVTQTKNLISRLL